MGFRFWLSFTLRHPLKAWKAYRLHRWEKRQMKNIPTMSFSELPPETQQALKDAINGDLPVLLINTKTGEVLFNGEKANLRDPNPKEPQSPSNN